MEQPEIAQQPSLTEKEAPLRILIVVNLAWDSRLGAVRVYEELSEHWRKAGHTVEKFTMADAFPRWKGGRAGFALRQILFPLKAAAFLRANANRFDVVDAIIGALSESKERLGFRGLLVARSVGLYRLYDQFENLARQRWPQQPRGKFLGRIFYTFIKRRLSRASDAAVRHADLINVPNEVEADCLRSELGSGHQIVVQPYGLTEAQRKAFHAAAASVEKRLNRPKISFLGMWSPRKGAHDWPDIVRHVWQTHPDARFAFLGTMVQPEQIWSDLGLRSSEKIEIVTEYAQSDLPVLLGDCAVGAFPSYVEGFGLGVLEQLAAGVPTVAFDVAGPRDIIGPGSGNMLVPNGQVEEFARAICRVLEMDSAAYEQLSRRSAETAAQFDWSRIARETIDVYREELAGAGRPILFIQPFTIGLAGGGGGRILRALLEGAPLPWKSVCTAALRPAPWPNEVHLPARPSWGRIERTRLAMLPRISGGFFEKGFRKRLAEFSAREEALAIHTIPHSGLDFAHAHDVARELRLPFFISLHDDLAYTGVHEAGKSRHEGAMRAAWEQADARFVISEALGREYSRRYGERPYEIVTDGLKQTHQARLARPAAELRVYFMGLFHLSYERNLRAFLEGVRAFETQHPGIQVSVTCRCEHIRPHVWQDVKAITVLPYAGERQIEKDMESADLLYMPMPFGSEHENFARYSVSTKMVTYIGSGLPIFYHGPASSAAFEILHRNKAAIFVNTLVPAEIAKTLSEVISAPPAQVVENALSLARREFMLADQTKRFWSTIGNSLKTKAIPA